MMLMLMCGPYSEKNLRNAIANEGYFRICVFTSSLFQEKILALYKVVTIKQNKNKGKNEFKGVRSRKGKKHMF